MLIVDFCDTSVLSELEVRLNKLSMLTRVGNIVYSLWMRFSYLNICLTKNKGAKHERRKSLTASETDAIDAFDFLNETTRIIDLQSTLGEDEFKRSSDSGINLTGRRDSLTESLTSGNTSTEGSNNTQSLLLDDYSSDEEGLSFILQEMVEMSEAELNRGNLIVMLTNSKGWVRLPFVVS